MPIAKGILLIATGHANYGNMAYNLACSIKSVEDIQVAVIYDGVSLSHLTATQRTIFNKMIHVPDDYRTGFGLKLHLDQLTPFDHTLFLDVDMLWLGRKPSELMDSCEGQFKIITEGDSDKPNLKYYFWADPEDIKKQYGVEKIYQTRSEVIYFEKGCRVFEKARELTPELKLTTIRRFGTFIPDELYFNIAIALLGIEVTGFAPAYWSRLNNEVMPNLSVLYKDYFLLSFGSNAASPIMKRAYDNVMQVVSNKLRLPYIFKLKSKKEWAPGRLKI